MSKKYWPTLYSKLLYKVGQGFCLASPQNTDLGLTFENIHVNKEFSTQKGKTNGQRTKKVQVLLFVFKLAKNRLSATFMNACNMCSSVRHSVCSLYRYSP